MTNMRYVEVVLVGIPLVYLFFVGLLLATGSDKYFLPSEGQLLTGTVLESQESLTFMELSEVQTKEEMRTQPFDINNTGIYSTLQEAGSAWGYIRQIANLEASLITMPLKEVAGDAGDDEPRSDYAIFNIVFWTFFILPSHILVVFAVLFFLRGG